MKFKRLLSALLVSVMVLSLAACGGGSSSEEEESSNTVLTNQTIHNTLSLKTDDNTLKSIKIDDKLISGFTSKSFEYSVEVDSLVDKIKLTSVLNDE